MNASAISGAEFILRVSEKKTKQKPKETEVNRTKMKENRRDGCKNFPKISTKCLKVFPISAGADLKHRYSMSAKAMTFSDIPCDRDEVKKRKGQWNFTMSNGPDLMSKMLSALKVRVGFH